MKLCNLKKLNNSLNVYVSVVCYLFIKGQLQSLGKNLDGLITQMMTLISHLGYNDICFIYYRNTDTEIKF